MLDCACPISDFLCTFIHAGHFVISADVSSELLSSFEMSEEEFDPVLQVPFAVTGTGTTVPSYSIPPKVLYALDPRRRLEDDIRLKSMAEELGPYSIEIFWQFGASIHKSSIFSILLFSGIFNIIFSTKGCLALL